jgi:hypothetical protein
VSLKFTRDRAIARNVKYCGQNLVRANAYTFPIKAVIVAEIYFPNRGNLRAQAMPYFA